MSILIGFLIWVSTAVFPIGLLMFVLWYDEDLEFYIIGLPILIYEILVAAFFVAFLERWI